MRIDDNDSMNTPFPQQDILVSLITLAIGLYLVIEAPFLSVMNLAGLFLVGASAGIVVGYRKRKWPGALRWGILIGLVVIGTFCLVVWSGLLPERESPSLPLEYQTP
jgi:hypothetical protein